MTVHISHIQYYDPRVQYLPMYFVIALKPKNKKTKKKNKKKQVVTWPVLSKRPVRIDLLKAQGPERSKRLTASAARHNGECSSYRYMVDSKGADLISIRYPDSLSA